MRQAMFLLIAISAVLMTSALSRSSADAAFETHSVFQNIQQAGVASYYSYECRDQPMANGKAFDPEKRTCASWFYGLGTVLTVKSLETGRATEVIVTDRGPNKRLVKKGRVIDLSKKAFEDICALKKGLTEVMITVKK